jgi:hypothetical protein
MAQNLPTHGIVAEESWKYRRRRVIMPSTPTHVTHIRWFNDLGLDDVPLVDSISLNPDAVHKTLLAIAEMEQQLAT